MTQQNNNYIPFLKSWDVLDLLELVEEISGGNRKHPVMEEYKYLSKSNRNSTAFLYDLEDDDLSIINDYLISNYGYKKGEHIIFWLSW
jgi:hypothetical protein